MSLSVEHVLVQGQQRPRREEEVQVLERLGQEVGVHAVAQPAVADMSEDDMEGVCQSVREDGAFIEAGENDNLIVQKLIDDKGMYGVFGYSFLEENADRLQAATLNGMIPTAEAIAADEYPVARSLFFYVKKEHVGTIPGIAEFVGEFTSDDAAGEDGYLLDKGLIPLPQADLEAYRKAGADLTPLSL